MARKYQNNLEPFTDGELIKLVTRVKLDNNRVVALKTYMVPIIKQLKWKGSHRAGLQEEIKILHGINIDKYGLIGLNAMKYLNFFL